MIYHRVLVCGGRHYNDASRMRLTLDPLHDSHPFTELIEGGAGGADRLAREWAERRNIPVRTFLADWDKYGRSAGPIRNTDMLVNGRPHLVVAFPGGKGTVNMMKVARGLGVCVMEIV